MNLMHLYPQRLGLRSTIAIALGRLDHTKGDDEETKEEKQVKSLSEFLRNFIEPATSS